MNDGVRFGLGLDFIASPRRQRCRRSQLYGLSFLSKISPTSAGFAFPLLSFITCPFRKFNAAALPALKSAADPGLAAIASSQNLSRALTSLTCARPFFSTIVTGDPPAANI